MSDGDGHAELPVAARVRALEERLIAAGLATDAELDEILTEVFDSASPANGARMVARAWTDPAYRARLLADGNAAAAELGFAAGTTGYLLKAVENTPAVHNVIVCTLCSCYPTALLGPSPSWYKSFAYRSRVVREPRAVLAEFGLELPGDTEIRVWDANSETRYLVVPLPPESAAAMDEDAMASLVTRNGLIGTALR
jgi:nitrile hydratase subunit alpha